MLRAHLWVQSGSAVFKEYTDALPERIAKCRYNLLRLSAMPELVQIPALVLPDKILFSEDGIAGYIMPFCRGERLGRFLHDPDIRDRTKWNAMINLAKCINALPDGVFIGDLHGDNVLSEPDGAIHIVDCDSFSLKGGYPIASPARAFLEQPCLSGCGKYFENGQMRISRETDILCYFVIFLQWLSGEEDLLKYTEADWFGYLEKLDETGFPQEWMTMIRRLFAPEPNILDENAIRSPSMIGWISGKGRAL